MFTTQQNWRIFKRKKQVMTGISAAALTLAIGVSSAIAAPTNGVVAGGAAVADITAGADTIIDQHAPVANITWDTFSTDATESVTFNQLPTDTAINKVLSGASELRGALNADGRVVIMNKAGVTFFPGSHTNVGSLLTTTADNVAVNGAGNELTFSGSGEGTIINNGDIVVSDGGFAVLAAPYVENNGSIIANLGQAQLVSGNNYVASIDLRGDDLIKYAVSNEDLNKIGIKNTGTLQAKSGTVALNAGIVSGIVNGTVNLGGALDANAFATDSHGGTVLVRSALPTEITTDVSANGDGNGKGGKIDIKTTNFADVSTKSLTVTGKDNATLNVDSDGNLLVDGDVNVVVDNNSGLPNKNVEASATLLSSYDLAITGDVNVVANTGLTTEFDRTGANATLTIQSGRLKGGFGGEPVEMQALANTYNTALATYQTTLTAYKTSLDDYNAGKASYNTVLANYTTLKAAYDTQLAAYNALVTPTQSDFDPVNTEYAHVQGELASLQTAFDDANVAFGDAETAFDTQSALFDTINDQYTTTLATLNTFNDKAKADLTIGGDVTVVATVDRDHTLRPGMEQGANAYVGINSADELTLNNVTATANTLYTPAYNTGLSGCEQGGCAETEGTNWADAKIVLVAGEHSATGMLTVNDLTALANGSTSTAELYAAMDIQSNDQTYLGADPKAIFTNGAFGDGTGANMDLVQSRSNALKEADADCTLDTAALVFGTDACELTLVEIDAPEGPQGPLGVEFASAPEAPVIPSSSSSSGTSTSSSSSGTSTSSSSSGTSTSSSSSGGESSTSSSSSGSSTSSSSSGGDFHEEPHDDTVEIEDPGETNPAAGEETAEGEFCAVVNVSNSKVCQDESPVIANKQAPIIKQMAQKILRMVIPPVMAKEENFNDIAPAAGPVDWNYHKAIKGGK